MSAKSYARMSAAAVLIALPFLLTVPPAAAAPNVVIGPACNQGSTTGVSITNFMFTSSSITVNVGDVVEWTNNAANTQHTTTEDYLEFDSIAKFVTILIDPPLWHSGPLAAGGVGKFSVQFCQTGTFEYHCDIHTFMTADITVV